MKRTILCFGNPLLDFDSLALKVGDKLKKNYLNNDIDIIFISQLDELFNYNLQKVYILDIEKNLKNNDVRLLHDIDKIQNHVINTLHDFDLAYFLKLLKAMGRINDVNIICISSCGNIDAIADKVNNIINNII